jgi:hypothetical protein
VHDVHGHPEGGGKVPNVVNRLGVALQFICKVKPTVVHHAAEARLQEGLGGLHQVLPRAQLGLSVVCVAEPSCRCCCSCCWSEAWDLWRVAGSHSSAGVPPGVADLPTVCQAVADSCAGAVVCHVQECGLRVLLLNGHREALHGLLLAQGVGHDCCCVAVVGIAPPLLGTQQHLVCVCSVCARKGRSSSKVV